jgi:ubiquitin-conjugating enzyme E2 Q
MYVNHPNLAPREQLTNLYSGGGPPTPASISVGRALADFEPGTLDLSTLPRLQPPSFATDAATKSLSRELKRLQALQSSTPLHELGWYMDFDSVSNLFQWIVQLHSFDPSLPLSKDMKQAGVTSIVLELRFGPDYPYSPPFVRVVRPRFLPFVQGGGGHVTAGGAMCMELLTSSGWSPANSMESVFLQVRMALCTLEPRPGRLDPKFLKKNKDESSVTGGDYGVGEAIDAFVRAANSHGWTVPEGLRTTAMGV